MKNEKTSIEKSHSKSSNASLTLLCLFTLISFCAIWVGLAFLKVSWFPVQAAWVISIAGLVLTILGIFGFSSFKR